MSIDLLDLRQGTLVLLNDIQNASDYALGVGSRYRAITLNECINQSMHFYERLLNANYQGYLSRTETIDIQPNVSEYDLDVLLPDLFRSPVYEVRRIINNVNYYLKERTPYLYNLTTESIPNTTWLPDFWLQGHVIHFTAPPAEAEVDAVHIRFQEKLLNLSSDSDELNQQLHDAANCIKIRAAVRALKAKDVSGALKTIGGWEKELVEEERTFFQQVGNRYVPPLKPIPVGYMEDYLY